MQHFSNRFAMNHILPDVKLPAFIKVFFKNTEVANVKIVMNKSKVKGKVKGGAMLTTCWKEVVEKTDMRAGGIYVFCFRGSRDGLKLLIDAL